MKLFVEHPCPVRLPARQLQGFSMVELMVSVWIWTWIVVAGLFAVHLMGLREIRLLESKAGASDSARRQIGQLRNDIYGAKGWKIGSWNGSSFVSIGAGTNQRGNALIIYPLIITSNQIVDLTKYVLYYFDSSDMANNNGRLFYLNSTNGVSRVSVSNLIPPLYFTSEDFIGRTNTVLAYKSVIHATFQYSQFQYPLTQVGSNSLFNSYRIDLRATPHLPDGP
jgi:hypothetical protein